MDVNSKDDELRIAFLMSRLIFEDFINFDFRGYSRYLLGRFLPAEGQVTRFTFYLFVEKPKRMPFQSLTRNPKISLL